VTTYGVSLYVYLCSISLGKKSLKIPKGVFRSRKERKDRHHNGKKKDKRTNNALQHITQKTNDRAPRNPVKIGVSIGVPEGTTVLAPAVIPVVLLENDTTI